MFILEFFILLALAIMIFGHICKSEAKMPMIISDA